MDQLKIEEMVVIRGGWNLDGKGTDNIAESNFIVEIEGITVGSF